MFKFSTKLNKNKINKYSNFQINNIMPQLIIIATIIILLGIGFYYQERYPLAIIWLCFGVLYIPVILLVKKISQIVFNKKPFTKTINTDEIYIFDNHEIVIQQKSIDGFNAKVAYSYNDIYAFFKTKNDYVLFFSKEQTHIIPVKSIMEGTNGEFEEFMKKRLATKYKEKSFSI